MVLSKLVNQLAGLALAAFVLADTAVDHSLLPAGTVAFLDRHFPALGCFTKLTEPVVAVSAIVSPEKGGWSLANLGQLVAAGRIAAAEALGTPLALDGNNLAVAFLMLAVGVTVLRVDPRWWWRPTHDAVALLGKLLPTWEVLLNVLCVIPALVYFMRYTLAGARLLSAEALPVDLMRGEGVAVHLYMMLLTAVLVAGPFSLMVLTGDDYRRWKATAVIDRLLAMLASNRRAYEVPPGEVPPDEAGGGGTGGRGDEGAGGGGVGD